jgi:hypothetical protein
MIAGGAGAAVLAGLGYRAWDRGAFTSGEGPAFEAWKDWQGHAGEGLTRPLHAAVLAASAHNSQPWLFEPHEDSITVYADLSRNLGAADPFRRELYFSLGCALQNIFRVAGRFGLTVFPAATSGTLRPNPPGKIMDAVRIVLAPIATSGFASDSSDPRLVEAIPKRHTNRGPYLPDKAVPRDTPMFGRNGSPLSVAIADAGARRALAALIIEATERFIADKQMSEDSGRWFRTGRRDILRFRDGVTTETAGLSPVVTTAAKLLPDQDAVSADKYWLQSTRDTQLPTAPLFGVMFVANRFDMQETLSAGSEWQFIHLTATVLGLSAQPLNQPIEMMDRDHFLGRKNDYAKEIRKIAGVKQGDPAFIFRLGYAERPAVASPRRQLQDVIKATA